MMKIIYLEKTAFSGMNGASRGISRVFTALIVCMLFVFAPIHAQRIDPERAERVAQGYVQQKRGMRTSPEVLLNHTVTRRHEHHAGATRRPAGATGARQRTTQTTQQDTVFYYVFNIDETAGGGFVIVAADETVRPVLGYSSNGRYDEDNLPPNFAYWMNFLQEQIEYVHTNKLKQSDVAKKEWDAYASISGIKPLSSGSVAPLIKTKWDQDYPYNLSCPIPFGIRAPAGCAATAMSQIMNYHQFPENGIGRSVPYTTNTMRVNIPSVNLEVNYDWTNMLDFYDDSATPQQEEAVATLMYHCGVSTKMDYLCFGAGSYLINVFEALTTHFGYDKNMQIKYRIDNNETEWETILKAQIDDGLPVFYTGFYVDWYGTFDPDKMDVGHAFICDGYDDENRFHFNWGWSGEYDGYYLISALEPGIHQFNCSQEIIIGIKPEYGYLKELNISAGTISPTFKSLVVS